jgi:diguanylate cyclase (GGDEF)-like protein
MARPDPALEDQSRYLFQTQRLSRVGSWCANPATSAVTASTVLLELHSRDRPIRSFADLLECVHLDDRPTVDAALDRLRRSGEQLAVRYRTSATADAGERWLDARGVAERAADGTITHLVGTTADVTGFVLAEQRDRSVQAELRQADSYQQAVITAVPDVIHIYDVAARTLVRANRSARPLIGFTDEMVQVMSGTNVEERLDLKDVRKLDKLLVTAQTLPDGQVVQLHHPVRHEDGGVRWLSRRLTPFARDDTGAVTSVLVVSRDMTDVVSLEHDLKHAALHDDLTGLPNRRLIHDRIAHSLRRAARGGRVAVLACDLDGFKRINDSHGHRTGDEVLIEVARRLQDLIRSGDTVARLGGDEFLLVLDIGEDLDPAQLAEQVAQRVAEEISQPIWFAGHEHAVSVSIGISLDQDASNAETLLSDADTAMYYVKRHGANGHAFFHPSQRPDIAAHDHIERQIRRALAHDAVEVFYQPIIDPQTERVHGVEALLRLRDKYGQFLNTAQVIDVAERTGLIGAVDERVLAIACARTQVWRQLPEHADLRLNINRSVKDITRPGFYERIMQALADSGLDPRALTVEITETVLLDATADNLADLRALSDHGIGLAIDDFGTGFASLRYLAELPITCIKLDRSFTQRLPQDPTATTLVAATIGLAEQLGISCTVEGVETLAQLNALPLYHATLIQGFLYARPHSGAEPPAQYIRAGASSGQLDSLVS